MNVAIAVAVGMVGISLCIGGVCLALNRIASALEMANIIASGIQHQFIIPEENEQ